MNAVYIEGYSREIDHCPLCGGETHTYYADGCNGCFECESKFYVIVKEEGENRKIGP